MNNRCVLAESILIRVFNQYHPDWMSNAFIWVNDNDVLGYILRTRKSCYLLIIKKSEDGQTLLT